ncbi:unnamed protein product [Heligmosomoides polygyrus]|uniref:Uncharacterized protein n=1 Tax=Heligmosomoides polygyrus TaxID=6339 RepID=A0A183FG70_HELPZ|nr:unnamed protein product [Heligmosomoides polygyrus]
MCSQSARGEPKWLCCASRIERNRALISRLVSQRRVQYDDEGEDDEKTARRDSGAAAGEVPASDEGLDEVMQFRCRDSSFQSARVLVIVESGLIRLWSRPTSAIVHSKMQLNVALTGFPSSPWRMNVSCSHMRGRISVTAPRRRPRGGHSRPISAIPGQFRIILSFSLFAQDNQEISGFLGTTTLTCHSWADKGKKST